MKSDTNDIPQDLSRVLDHLGSRFMQEFLEAELERHPDNVEALAELGQVYTRLGHWEEGLTVDRQLAGLVPQSPTVHYNLACSQALLGRAEEAIDSLERAASLGYDDVGYMQNDDDLASVRSEERFRALIERIRSGKPSRKS